MTRETIPTVPVARVKGLFGSDGELTLALYPGFPDNFDPAQPLFATVDGLQIPLYAGRFERRGVAGALVRFDDIDTARRAQEFIGAELSANAASASEDDDSFRFEDLIGFEATVGTRKGRIADFYDHEANPLFELEIGGRRSLVPAVEEFIARIDFRRHTIRFVLPEGLLDPM